MNIGQKIINEIIKQGMVTIQMCPNGPNEEPHVLHWKANADEQLTALVENDPVLPRPNKRLGGEEKKVILECDEKLEAVQDYMRGATGVKPIRAAIAERLNPRCPHCNTRMNYEEDRALEGELTQAPWWNCPGCNHNEEAA